MTTPFLPLLNNKPPFPELVSGYTEIELRKIASLYDISIDGLLKSFLMEVGRCAGGMFSDDAIPLYRQLWSVRTHLLFQVGFYETLQEAGAFGHLKSPFVLGW